MKYLAMMLVVAGVALGSDQGGIDGESLVKAMSIAGAVIGLGLAALGGGIGMGNAAAAAISGSARNPSMAPKLQTTMFVAIALIEAQVIYTLVFSIIAMFANPFL